MEKSIRTSSKKNRQYKKLTLLDVAAAAGVSKSTVSRILDERLPRSESNTARRVRQVALELGYVRDSSATNLRRGKTMTLGVIVPRLTDTVMSMFYESITQAANQLHLFTIVAITDDKPEQVRNAADRLLAQGVDGLILTTARNDDDFPSELRSRSVPFVLALRTDGCSPSSIGDDELGGYLAARHLLDLGHTQIGLIGGPEFASSAQMRVEGFRKALTDAGVTLNPELHLPSTFGIESGAEVAGEILRKNNQITAIFAVNDNTAIGALSAIHRLGLQVPHDISVVGYNDIPLVSLLPVPLTTVRVPFHQIAKNALDLILSQHHESTVKMATPTLIPRNTTTRCPNLYAANIK